MPDTISVRGMHRCVRLVGEGARQIGGGPLTNVDLEVIRPFQAPGGDREDR